MREIRNFGYVGFFLYQNCFNNEFGFESLVVLLLLKVLININYETCELSVPIIVKRSGQPGCNGNDISRHQVEYYVAGACSIESG